MLVFFLTVFSKEASYIQGLFFQLPVRWDVVIFGLVKHGSIVACYMTKFQVRLYIWHSGRRASAVLLEQ